ncbi:MAG: SoxR reducing system RseC family protein [Acholeplasmataceae bacterium]|nr:SoxR reducing system RseC family protein [Acidaminococcaceae bacterium]NLY84248.1 SoxR reducing system RseC family protein [Acholeplasmataceae bacterium]
MTEIVGFIIAVKGERAKVKIDKSGSEASNLPKYMDCWNKIDAKEGAKVKIEMQELDAGKARKIIIALPVLFAIAGASFGRVIANYLAVERLWTIGASTLLWLFMGWTYTGTFRRDAVRKGEQPVVVDVIY